MKLTWSQLKAFRVGCFTYGVRMYVTGPEFPQITVPHKMVEKLNRIKTRQAIEEAKKKKRVNFKSHTIVSGKRQEYNHHAGQPFNEFDVQKLASHGWKHYRSKGDYFTIKGHKVNPALHNESEDVRMFDELGLDDRIVNVLQDQGISKPTRIQSLLIPPMLQGYNTICAAETGSGKTFAYLLPILHNILRERSGSGDEVSTVQYAPKAIIILPSYELITQLTEVLKVFAQELSLTVAYVDVKGTLLIDRNMDIVVTTPKTLIKMLRRRRFKTNNLSYLMLDEADTLLDDSFNKLIAYIVRRLKIGGSSPTEHSKYVSDGIQVGLASATYPRGLDTLLEPVLSMEDFEVVTTNSLHHLMPHVPQKFFRVGAADKMMECAKLLKQHKGKPTIVFCNKTQTSYWLSKSLKEIQMDNILLTGFDDPQTRKRHLKKFYEGVHDVMICTDIASRGLDTQCVHHVINYDFPLFMSDYIHRVGRVGRVGTTHDCRVTSFITQVWDVDLLWKIETAARKQQVLHNVNANIKRKRTAIIEEKYGVAADD